MNLEFPTLKIAVPDKKIRSALNDIIQNNGAKIRNHERKTIVTHTYQYTLAEKDVEIKLNQMASRRLRSKEYLFFFLGLFFLAIFTELIILKVFFGSEGDKTVSYFQVEKSTSNTSEKVLIRNKTTTIATSRGLQPWVAVLLISASGSSFFALYGSRKVHRKKMESLKNEITDELKEKKIDVTYENRSEEVELDILKYQEHTEIVFESDRGSPLIAHLAVSLIDMSNEGLNEAEIKSTVIGNRSMEQLLQRFQDQRIRQWDLNHQVLDQINYCEEFGELRYDKQAKKWV